ncbi:MAG: ATP synthase subunit I [Deltaproteobacteria bacterium]|nr:ATP synthase subunit I [Deltaproteobacteria bacterium]
MNPGQNLGLLGLGEGVGLFGAGLLIGFFYFGGLWLTLKRLLGKGSGGVGLSISFLVRAGLALALFWWLGAGDWRRLGVLVAGFTGARFFSVRYLPPNKSESWR